MCLDPRVMTDFLDETAGVVLMSGTLSPLSMFRDLVGLKPESELKDLIQYFLKKTN